MLSDFLDLSKIIDKELIFFLTKLAAFEMFFM